MIVEYYDYNEVAQVVILEFFYNVSGTLTPLHVCLPAIFLQPYFCLCVVADSADSRGDDVRTRI